MFHIRLNFVINELKIYFKEIERCVLAVSFSLSWMDSLFMSEEHALFFYIIGHFPFGGY